MKKPALVPTDTMKYQIQGDNRMTPNKKAHFILLSTVSLSTQGC